MIMDIIINGHSNAEHNGTNLTHEIYLNVIIGTVVSLAAKDRSSIFVNDHV